MDIELGGTLIACVLMPTAMFCGSIGTANYIAQKNARETKKSLVSINPEMTLIKKEIVHIPAEDYYGSMRHLSHEAYDFTRLYFDTDGNLETPEICSYHRVRGCSEHEERLKEECIGTKRTFKEWDSKLVCPHKEKDFFAHYQRYERCKD